MEKIRREDSRLDRLLAWLGFVRLRVMDLDLVSGRERRYSKLVRVGRDWNRRHVLGYELQIPGGGG